jgi:hypothetical protein
MSNNVLSSRHLLATVTSKTGAKWQALDKDPLENVLKMTYTNVCRQSTTPWRLIGESMQRYTSFLTSTARWVVSFTPLPLYSRGKRPRWAPELVWTTWRRENYWPYRDSNSDSSVVQSITSHYTEFAIPALTGNTHNIWISTVSI